MRRHWFFILLSLADRDRHGSGIMRDVLELTNDELKLWPVTLYGSLDELHEHGWIRALDKAPASVAEEGGRKRWFRITPAGSRAFTARCSASCRANCATFTARRWNASSSTSSAPRETVDSSPRLASGLLGSPISCAARPTNTGAGE